MDVKKKVGILTFHRAINYGAVLQTWALCKFLNNHDFNTSVIDYRCRAIECNYKLFSIAKFRSLKITGKIKYVITRILRINYILKKNKLFKNFIKDEMPLTPLDDANNLEICITGSDQVWNPILTGGLDEKYLLQSSLFTGKRKIAYAVSSEPACLKEIDISSIQKSLYSFDAVSVREKSLVELFSTSSDVKISVCSDPTFLISEDVYETIIGERLLQYPYLFVFQVVKSNNTIRLAKEIACKLKLKVIYLNARNDLFEKPSNLNFPVGPKEFLNLIKYASFVVTTSFHGTVFSIIFKKQFIFVKTGKSNRQVSLLQDLALKDRIIDRNLPENLNQIDYEKLNIKDYTEKSKTFLIEALSM